MSETSATTQFKLALIDDNQGEVTRLLPLVPTQDRLAIGAQLGNPDMVGQALKDGADPNKPGSREANAGQQSPMLTAVTNAKFAGGNGPNQVDAFLGRAVDVNADTTGREKVIQMLSEAGASATFAGQPISEFLSLANKTGRSANPDDTRILDVVKAAEAREATKGVSVSGHDRPLPTPPAGNGQRFR